jgi:polyisoprenoid-binding protein YceI
MNLENILRNKVFVSTCSLLLFVASASATKYEIDPDHSKVSFKIKHLTISNVVGNFQNFKGTFSYDPKNVAASAASAEIKADSINTDNMKRDTHLKDPDFFNVDKFPALSFKSTKVTPKNDKEFVLNGELTMKGVTKPVELVVGYQGVAKDPMGQERAAFSASTKLNRKDWGLTWNKLMEAGGLVVGEDVTVDIEIEGIKAKA